MGISFRHSAGFGKRMEYNLVGKMLMEGLDVYMPLVDDHGVDCVIKKEDGTFIEVQIKARSNEAKMPEKEASGLMEIVRINPELRKNTARNSSRNI